MRTCGNQATSGRVRGHLGEGHEQTAQGLALLVGCATGGGRHGALDQGEDRHRPAQPGTGFGQRRVPTGTSPGRPIGLRLLGGGATTALRPRRGRLGGVRQAAEPGVAHRRVGDATDDQRRLDLTARDGPTRLGQQLVGPGAAVGGLHAPARRDAEAFGDHRPAVVVAEDRQGRGQHQPDMGQRVGAGVGHRQAHGVLDQVDRVGEPLRVLVGHLGRTDDDRSRDVPPTPVPPWPGTMARPDPVAPIDGSSSRSFRAPLGDGREQAVPR